MSLYVDETGTRDAPSIVFLHGVGTSGWMWQRQTAALADFHCLNVDMPGHGRSNTIAWVSLADTAEQIAQIIGTRANGGRAHVVGLSLGGQVALILLERHAALLDRVIMSGVTAAPMPNRIFLQPQLALSTFLMKRRWFADMQAKSRPLHADEQQALADNLLAMSSDAYRRIFTEVVDYAVPPALRTVETPTLVTAGGNETAIIVEAVRVIARMMPHAEGRIAPGCGHGWNVEATALFDAMVRAWVTGAPLPDGLRRIAN